MNIKDVFESAFYNAVCSFSKECGTMDDYAASIRSKGNAIIRRAKQKKGKRYCVKINKIILLLLITLSISSYSQFNYKNCEINFNMFAPMCSTKPGGLFAVESGVSIQQPIGKFLNSGIGASCIVFIEPNDNYLENGGTLWNYNPSFYIPVDFSTKPIKNFSFSVTAGPIFDMNDINLMFKVGAKYVVDSGQLKPNWNYKVYLYINDVMTNFSIHGMYNDNLIQVGIGLSI